MHFSPELAFYSPLLAPVARDAAVALSLGGRTGVARLAKRPPRPFAPSLCRIGTDTVRVDHHHILAVLFAAGALRSHPLVRLLLYGWP